MKIVRLGVELTFIACVFLAILVVGIVLTVRLPQESPERLSFDPPGQSLASNSDAKLKADIQAFEASNTYRVR